MGSDPQYPGRPRQNGRGGCPIRYGLPRGRFTESEYFRAAVPQSRGYGRPTGFWCHAAMERRLGRRDFPARPTAAIRSERKRRECPYEILLLGRLPERARLDPHVRIRAVQPPYQRAVQNKRLVRCGRQCLTLVEFPKGTRAERQRPGKRGQLPTAHFKYLSRVRAQSRRLICPR